ncbi:hypothetical protein KGQ20_30475 [Catenulispora sp. NF23]|uniref:hypothetical protein n=1 Tax=Catenulispora pinistramenti TaxID=2705254 RepID=UPI001BAB3118|nr:hypothetical protein [Catenulispora pinistramenti]MBS2537091.1 hypothetical protein [Catenulispora pinistramenti]
MELVLVVLTAPTPAAGTRISPQILADILWANATPADGLQHVNVRPGPEPGSHTLGMFLISEKEPGTAHAADAASRTVLDLCQRAIAGSPPLSRWAAVIRANSATSHSPGSLS